MQTPTQCVTKRTKPAAPAPLPFPTLEQHKGKLFWLAAYFIDLSKAETLGQVADEMHRRRRSGIVTLSLASGRHALEEESRQSLQHAIKNGLLPFAHPTTTVFDQQVAA